MYVESQARIGKERSMRRKRFKRYWARLKELQRQRPRYSTLLMKLGAAAHEAGRTSALAKVTLPDAPPKGEREKRVDFTFSLDRAALKKVRRREGRYLLRSNLTDTDPAKLWEFYLQLSEVDNAFKELKGDLAIRPIHHQNEQRIGEYLRRLHRFLSAGHAQTITQATRPRTHPARGAREARRHMQLLDAHFPTTDGRELVFTRYTQPEPDQQLLLAQLGWGLPEQARPRITAKSTVAV